MTVKQQMTFPEVATIRKGTPKVKGKNGFIQGSDLGNKFRIVFAPGTADAKQAFHNSWKANHPKDHPCYDPAVKYDMTYRRPGVYAEVDGFEVDRLRAMVPFRSVFDAWQWANEAHSAGRMVAKADDDHYLMLRDPINGAYLVQDGEPYREYRHGDSVVYERDGRKFTLPIRTVGRLRLFLPEVGRLVFFTLKTTSFYDRVNIDGQLAGIQFLADTLNNGNAAGIPFYVYRREQEITWNKPDGSAARIKKWLINIEADPEWVASATRRMSNFALTGDTIVKALLPLNEPNIVGMINPDIEGDDELAEPAEPEYIDAQVEDAPPPEPPEDAFNQPAEPPQKIPQDDGKPLNGAQRPYVPEYLREKLKKLADGYRAQKFAASDKQRNFAAMLLNKCFAGQNDYEKMRHATVFYLVGKASLKDCDDAKILALMKWLDPQKDSGGDYTPGAHVEQEANAAYRAALLAEGQGLLPGV